MLDRKMMQEKLTQIFENTFYLCNTNETLRSSVRNSIESQKIYWEEDPVVCGSERFEKAAKMVLSAKRTMEAAKPYALEGKKVCVLNFASSVRPGGGVTWGSTAQEEGLCRISSLYPAISDENTVGAFYKRHKEMIISGEMDRRNRDDCIFTPGVKVFREDDTDCEILPENEWFTVDVITCAAPDQRYSPDGKNYQPKDEELLELMEKRIRKIIAIAALHEEDVLILGAFGCGVFRNSPYVVAKAFECIVNEYRTYFETVEFAIYSRPGRPENYRAFSQMEQIMTEDTYDEQHRCF